MTDDIVARLRVLNHHAKKLAENESLHDLYRDAFTRCENLTWEAADEIERLRGERDEARRMFCDLDAEMYGLFGDRDRLVVNRASYLPSDAARKRKWDCFKEPADA